MPVHQSGRSVAGTQGLGWRVAQTTLTLAGLMGCRHIRDPSGCVSPHVSTKQRIHVLTHAYSAFFYTGGLRSGLALKTGRNDDRAPRFTPASNT